MSRATPAAEQAAATQRALWGRRPRDWADHAETANAALFTAVLDHLRVGEGTRLLDAGCGSGLAAGMAADRGATVAGADATPELLAIARERTPAGDFREAPLEALPWPDGSFDAVAGINAFQFAADPVAAVREAARVAVPGGLVAATTFAEPERNEGTVLHLAMKATRPPEPGEGYAPYALSSPGGLEALVADAGLEVVSAHEVPVVWEHPDAEAMVRSLLGSAGGALAMEGAGEPAVRAAIEAALPPFTGSDGVVRLHNVFRVVVGRTTNPGAPA